MKKIILLVGVMIAAVVVNGQNVVNKSAIFDGELVSISEVKSGLYAFSSGYEVDAKGNVSGKVLSFYDNGNLQEVGSLIAGKKNGTWFSYDSQGNKINQAEYQNGQKDGEWKVWDANGTLRMEFNYADGKRVGNWKMYDENGQLVKETDYSK